MRLLIIDDSSTVLEATAIVFEERGDEVHTAESGEEALAKLARFEPDVILCDMQMPGLSGIDVVRAVNAARAEIPVLIFTEQRTVGMVVEAMRAGAFGYLLKGSPEDLLIREVEDALAHRRLLARNLELEAANHSYRTGLEKMVEEKTAEVRRLQHLHAEAEKRASLGTLIAGVAHEINNPLAVINSNLSWLAETVTELKSLLESTEVLSASARPRHPLWNDLDEMPRVVGEARGCGQRIQRIVASLKRVVPTGRKGAGCEVQSVIELVKTVCRAGVAAPSQVEWAIEEGLPEINVGEDDLIALMANLILNASQAVEPGKGRIRVSASAQEGHVLIEVADSGGGIPEAIQCRIFDPFFTTKPPGKGTGLGLSLVQQIALGAGGTVSLASEVGVGSRFMIRLPFAARAEPRIAKAG